MEKHSRRCSEDPETRSDVGRRLPGRGQAHAPAAASQTRTVDGRMYEVRADLDHYGTDGERSAVGFPEERRGEDAEFQTHR